MLILSCAIKVIGKPMSWVLERIANHRFISAKIVFTALLAGSVQLSSVNTLAETIEFPPIAEYSPINVQPNLYSLSLETAAQAGVAAECRPGTGNFNCTLTNAYIYPNSISVFIERGPIFRTGKLMLLYQLTRSFHETYSPSYFSRRI